MAGTAGSDLAELASLGQVTLHFLAYAPKGMFERYDCKVILVTARSDRIKLDPPEKKKIYPVSDKAGSGAKYEMRIIETSAVNAFT